MASTPLVVVVVMVVDDAGLKMDLEEKRWVVRAEEVEVTGGTAQGSFTGATGVSREDCCRSNDAIIDVVSFSIIGP